MINDRASPYLTPNLLQTPKLSANLIINKQELLDAERKEHSANMDNIAEVVDNIELNYDPNQADNVFEDEKKHNQTI